MRGGKDYGGFRAGTHLTRIHPLAMRAMVEWGIDISGATGYRAKGLEACRYQPPMDTVVAVCDEAARGCPLLAWHTQEHWRFPDPSAATGAEEERLTVFGRCAMPLQPVWIRPSNKKARGEKTASRSLQPKRDRCTTHEWEYSLFPLGDILFLRVPTRRFNQPGDFHFCIVHLMRSALLSGPAEDGTWLLKGIVCPSPVDDVETLAALGVRFAVPGGPYRAEDSLDLLALLPSALALLPLTLLAFLLLGKNLFVALALPGALAVWIPSLACILEVHSRPLPSECWSGAAPDAGPAGFSRQPQTIR